jgi:HK97 gp10 family phage protein
MIQYQIYPVGIGAMEAELGAIGTVSQKSGKEALKEVAPLIVEQAKANIHSITHRLENSVGWAETENGIEIFATAPYAYYVEEGTSKQAAQYYMKRAIDQYVDGGEGNTGIAGDKIAEKVKRDANIISAPAAAIATAEEMALLPMLLTMFSFITMGFTTLMGR